MTPIQDPLFEQMINEIRALLQQVNDTYKDFYHVNLLTVVDLGDMRCNDCIEANKRCVRCAVSYERKSILADDSVTDDSVAGDSEQL